MITQQNSIAMGVSGLRSWQGELPWKTGNSPYIIKCTGGELPMKNIIMALLILMVSLSPVDISAETIVNNLPAGDPEMINLSDGKLYFQAGDSIYRYEPDQPDPFIFEYQSPDEGLKFAFVFGGDLHYNLWEEVTLNPVNISEGQEKIELYPALVQNKSLSYVQPFLMSYAEENTLTFMAAAVSKQNGDLFFLCRLDTESRNFKNIEVDELKSFTNLKNGNTVYFNKTTDADGETYVFINEIDWHTMESTQIDSLPHTVLAPVYVENYGSTIYIDDKKVMTKIADKKAAFLMNLSDILDGSFAWPDQRGFLLQEIYYIVPIIVGSVSKVVQIKLDDLEKAVIR